MSVVNVAELNLNNGVANGNIPATTSLTLQPVNGFIIDFDILTANPKKFSISTAGMNFLDNTQNNTTDLSRICLLQDGLASLFIPPNPHTLEIVDTVLIQDNALLPTKSITLNSLVPSIDILGAGSISATGGLTLPSVVAFTNAVAPTCLANPLGSTDLCNKQYVDSLSAIPTLSQVLVAGNSAGTSNINMNNRNITGITTATTINGHTLTPQSVNFLTSNSGTPSGAKDDNMRAVYCNTSVADSLIAVTGTFPSVWGSILCSINWSSAYQGATWVGTDTGRLYWTIDNGVTWNLPFNGEIKFNGEIRCMAVLNGQLWFGGTFDTNLSSAQTANYIAYLDTFEIFNQSIWNGLGSNGFNNIVNTMVLDLASSIYLFIGGEFTADNGNILGTNKLCSVDTSLILYDTDGQTTGLNGNGFSGGNIFQIIINGAYTDNMAVCGSINFFQSNLLGQTLTCDNFCIWRFSGSTSNNNAVYPTFTNILTLDAKSSTVMSNGTIFYVGGDFTNTIEPTTFNSSPYFFNVDVGSYIQIDNPYNYISLYPITKMVLPPSLGIYWADSNGGVYFNGVFLVSAPFGSTWSWIGDVTYGGYFSTLSPSQDPITMYKWETSDLINIALNNPLVAPNGFTYTNNVVLNAKGSTVELVWNATGNNWYVLSSQGGVGFN